MAKRNIEKEATISLEWLRRLLSYDPVSGKLTWLRSPRRGIAPMSEAGCVRPDGYRTVMVDGKAFLAANLIWFLHTGEWPKYQVDHVNRNRGDDRWENLREATQSEQNYNQKIQSSNVTGVRGVSVDHTRRAYMASLIKNGKLVLRKRFPTMEEAVVARQRAEQIYCGDFLPQEYVGAAANG